MKNVPWKIPIVLAIFVCIGILIYSNTLNAPFTFDDDTRIVNNRQIRVTQLDFESLYDAAYGKKSSKKRPFGNLTFALNYYFHGYKLPGYHVVNISLHILTAIVLFFFIRATFQTPALRSRYDYSDLVSFFAVLIWLVHPLHTQTVTYIIQRLNNLAALFYVLAFWLYVKGRLLGGFSDGNSSAQASNNSAPQESPPGWMRYAPYGCFVAAALSWLLALLSKQISMTLPFAVFLYEWYFFQNLDRRWLRRSLLWLVGIAIILVGVGLVYVDFDPVSRFSRFYSYDRQEFTIWQRLLTEPRVVMHYLSLLIYPIPSRLNLDYDFPLSDSLFQPWTTLPAILAIIGLVAIALLIAKKERLISLCILWYFGNLVIESTIIPVAIIFEHRTYLPSMLVFVIPVFLLFRHIAWKWIPAAVAVGITILFSTWTFQRNYIWADEERLWADTVKKSPEKARPRNNLGKSLLNKGRLDEAIELFQKVLQLDPKHHHVRINLGIALKKKGDYDGALKQLTIALEKIKRKEAAFYWLGSLMQAEGENEKAAEYYREAIKFNPDYDKAYTGLGVVLSDLGEPELASKYYRQALEINPSNAEAHNNLAIKLAEAGEFNGADHHYRQALHLYPEFYEAYNNYGVLMAKTGKTEEAIRYFNKSLAINPEYAEAYMSLGITAQQQDRMEEAIAYWQKAVTIDPDHAEVHYNLGLAYSRIGKPDAAKNHFSQCLRVQPENADAHNGLGTVLIQTGNLVAAMDRFQQALDLQPNHADAKNNLAKTEKIIRRIENEIKKREAALQQDPGNPVSHFQVGDMYFDIGR